MLPKYQVGDKVCMYEWPATVLKVEVRAAGFPDYLIELEEGGCTWAQENELNEKYELTHTPIVIEI